MGINLAALPGDISTEVAAIEKTVAGVTKLVADAKAQGLTSVTIADLEALLPDAEAVVTDSEKLIADV
jgi:hypothetical protein